MHQPFNLDQRVQVSWKNERWYSVKQMWNWINQHVSSVGQLINLSPRQDLNLLPPKHLAGALSTWATENSWIARPYTRFIFWHASCKLQGSAMSRSYCVVKEWKMVNVKLGWNKCENELQVSCLVVEVVTREIYSWLTCFVSICSLGALSSWCTQIWRLTWNSWVLCCHPKSSKNSWIRKCC